ncbi:hypothetical protein, partial [Blautia obeum]|uniref:hypothetical protein n=1 Tax=Blautia obeum TaxID=40520 RepID=UPI00356480D1
NLEEIFYFNNKKMPYLCGFWRFANAYFYFIIKGELEIRTLEEEYETRTAGVRSTAGGNYRKNISGR